VASLQKRVSLTPSFACATKNVRSDIFYVILAGAHALQKSCLLWFKQALLLCAMAAGSPKTGSRPAVALITMHEVGIIQDAVAMAERQARAQGAKHIHRLRLRIGQLSGVVPDALQFAFEVVTRDSMAASAVLEIENVPAAFWCAKCQAEFGCEDYVAECPRCHEWDAKLCRGRELELSSIEIS